MPSSRFAQTALCLSLTFVLPAFALAGERELRITKSLTNEPGDAKRGELIFADRDLGHCVLCHRAASLDAAFQGNVGPDLSLVGERLDAAELRLRVVDQSRVNPETVMPPYHRVNKLYRVLPEYVGVPVLDAQEIEDVVAYLLTLKNE